MPQPLGLQVHPRTLQRRTLLVAVRITCRPAGTYAIRLHPDDDQCLRTGDAYAVQISKLKNRRNSAAALADERLSVNLQIGVNRLFDFSLVVDLVGCGGRI